MDWRGQIALFELVDFVAVAALVVCWLGASLLAETSPLGRKSTAVLMAEYRRAWMREFVTREPRIFDSQIVGQLRQGTAFFASASMISIGGCLALLGNSEQLAGVATDLTLEAAPLIVWEIKLVLMLGLAVNAFLKFVWAHRLFGYCAVLMSAVPNEADDPRAYQIAHKAGEINVLAARSYNRGLRSVYFGIAAVGWLAGAWVLLGAVAFTMGVILRREFASQSRAVLLDEPTGK